MGWEVTGISRGEGRECQGSVGSEDNVCRLRGKIYLLTEKGIDGTPGSEVDAFISEDRHNRTRYA